MTTTFEVTIPISTVMIETTTIRTVFVTITTAVSPSAEYLEPSGESGPTATPTTSSRASSSSMSISPPETTLPDIQTQSSQMLLPSSTSSLEPFSEPATSTTMSSTSPSYIASSQQQSEKHMIVGGLSGSIGGLVLVGVCVCLILRFKRRRHHEHDASSLSEKGIAPMLRRKWTDLTAGKGTPKPTPQLQATSSPTTVDEDHHIIRMNTHHWPRPYAQGACEGYRDSVPSRQLRVVNPDTSLSRPGTPSRQFSDTPRGFLRRQNSGLSGILFGAARPRLQSRTNTAQHPLAQEISSNIAIDPMLSKECVAPIARTPSFRSYPSLSTLPIIRPHPPEDPFFAVPDGEKDLPAVPPSAYSPANKRPNLAPMQSAQRTLSSLSHTFLSPFRSTSAADQHILAARSPSRISSVSHACSTSPAMSIRSDPFNLSIDDTRENERAFAQRDGHRWELYEGT